MKYRCHECTIGQCYSEDPEKSFPMCLSTPVWKKLTDPYVKRRVS